MRGLRHRSPSSATFRILTRTLRALHQLWPVVKERCYLQLNLRPELVVLRIPSHMSHLFRTHPFPDNLGRPRLRDVGPKVPSAPSPGETWGRSALLRFREYTR